MIQQQISNYKHNGYGWYNCANICIVSLCVIIQQTKNGTRNEKN